MDSTSKTILYNHIISAINEMYNGNEYYKPEVQIADKIASQMTEIAASIFDRNVNIQTNGKQKEYTTDWEL